jgi:hypothetical protein
MASSFSERMTNDELGDVRSVRVSERFLFAQINEDSLGFDTCTAFLELELIIRKKGRELHRWRLKSAKFGDLFKRLTPSLARSLFSVGQQAWAMLPLGCPEFQRNHVDVPLVGGYLFNWVSRRRIGTSSARHLIRSSILFTCGWEGASATRISLSSGQQA